MGPQAPVYLQYTFTVKLRNIPYTAPGNPPAKAKNNSRSSYFNLKPLKHKLENLSRTLNPHG